MKNVTDLLGNINGSPKTTGAGLVLVLISLYMLYESTDTTYSSIEVGMLGVGLYLFVMPDKKEENNEE